MRVECETHEPDGAAPAAGAVDAGDQVAKGQGFASVFVFHGQGMGKRWLDPAGVRRQLPGLDFAGKRDAPVEEAFVGTARVPAVAGALSFGGIDQVRLVSSEKSIEGAAGNVGREIGDRDLTLGPGGPIWGIDLPDRPRQSRWPHDHVPSVRGLARPAQPAPARWIYRARGPARRDFK